MKWGIRVTLLRMTHISKSNCGLRTGEEDMAFVEALLVELGQERDNTRRMLERILEIKLDWKPHADLRGRSALRDAVDCHVTLGDHGPHH